MPRELIQLQYIRYVKDSPQPQQGQSIMKYCPYSIDVEKKYITYCYQYT